MITCETCGERIRRGPAFEAHRAICGVPDARRIPAVRHYQKGQTCYTGHMSAEEAARLTFADSYPPNVAEGMIGYQRPPDERRAKSFGEYLRDDEAGFMTPLLLNARDEIEFDEVIPGSGMGYLEITEGLDIIAKIDGQHRGIGAEQFLEDPGYPIPFMMFSGLDTEIEQELFIAINREQKKVSMSHVYFVGREGDELAEMVTRLESEPDSPWYHKVNLIGARGLGRPVSLQSLRSGLEDLLGSGRIKALTLDERYEIAKSYWQVVSEVWPDAWKNPRGHLLTKSIGMIALSQVGGDMLPDCLNGRGSAPHDILDRDKVAVLLGRARKVNWASRGGDFEGYAGRGGAKLVKDALDRIIYASEPSERDV